MKVKYAFRLPYKVGMETKPGFSAKETVEKGKYKGFPEDTEFALFKVEKEINREDFKQTDAELIDRGMEVLGQNTNRMADMSNLAKEFGIVFAGATGGLTATDKKLIGAMLEITTNYQKIAAAFTKKTGKAITAEEVQEIAAAQV